MAVAHRPFVWIALGFSVGIVLERAAVIPVWAWPCLILTGLGAAFFPSLRGKSRGVLLLLVCAGAGAMALRSYTSVPSDHIALYLSAYSKREVQLKCRVVSEVEYQSFGVQERSSFTAEARELSERGMAHKVSGRVLVTLFRREVVPPGAEILLSGRLLPPITIPGRGRLSYKETLLSRKVSAAFNVKKKGRCDVLRKSRGPVADLLARGCRGWIQDVFSRYLSAGEAGLINGLITGERKGIAEHVKEIFLRTGTTHLLAVSGLNVAMVAFGIFFVLGMLPVPRLVKLLAAIILTGCYAAIAGGSSPVVRSAVMSAVFILGFVLEREQEALNTLAIASMAILVVTPTQLFDVGFQLSFAGVLSLVLVVPLIAGIFPEGQPGRLWNEYLGVSLAAFLGTSGIVAYYFGTITPVGLLANIPAVPLVALITALGGLLLVVSAVPALAMTVAVALKAALNLLVFILYLFTYIPGGFLYLEVIPDLWQVVLYYLILLFLINRLHL